ncbi:hypothetical protein HEK616_36570 [Streptomyces nigrescens]|uniref:Lasso RiPP family leader peptide-containing protein n=2 Tax=Streptomyces TaxID=1883 RepID=A0ABN6QY01_STRNI|nr:hypothetical protein HEK616_36570 [Streptomyces nigrescens]
MGSGSGRGPVCRFAVVPGAAAATNDEGDVMKKAYEAPTLVRLGTFRKKTGLLNSSGNDRLILSKN